MDTLLMWVNGHYNEFKVALNLTTSIFLFIISFAIIHFVYVRWNEFRTSLKTMLIGASLEAFGWGLHRFYWATNFLDNLLDPWISPIAFGGKNAWVGDLPIYIAALGTLLIIAPLLNYVQAVRSKDYVVTIVAYLTLLFGIYTLMLMLTH